MDRCTDGRMDRENHIWRWVPHLKNNKTNKGIGVIIKPHNVVPHRTLLPIYKCFIRANLHNGDFVSNQPNNDSICSKKESV